jgi:tetratricopeptide (TPR) repeat protein
MARLLAHPLSYVRAERNWTYQDLVNVIARRINTANRREKAWRWEHWGVEPDEDSQLALAAELGVPTESVHALGWPGWLPIGARIDTDAPWNVDGGLALLADAAGGAMLDRRGFLTIGTGVAATMAGEWLTVEPSEIGSVLRGGRVGPGLVNSLEQRLPALRQMDHALGGGSVREIVDAELRLVTDLLAKGSYSEPVGRRLFAVAAELARVAGWASCDSGRHAAAERYWVAGLRAAHLARDRGIGANILKSMSLQRADIDRLDEALALARVAREGFGSGSSRVVAMLTVRQARMHAMRGETLDCEALLALAETHLNRADGQAVPAWATYFDEAEYCAQVAACHLTLGRHRATVHWLSQALAVQPDERGRDRATYLIWCANAVLQLGDIEQACALAGTAIRDITATRSSRNQRRFADLHTKLVKNRNLPAVRDLDEAARPLIAWSA